LHVPLQAASHFLIPLLDIFRRLRLVVFAVAAVLVIIVRLEVYLIDVVIDSLLVVVQWLVILSILIGIRSRASSRILVGILYYLHAISIRIDNGIGLVIQLPSLRDLQLLQVHVRHGTFHNLKLRIAIDGHRGILQALQRFASDLVLVELVRVKLGLRRDLLLVADESGHEA
jgi:hypothetical protein